MVIVEFARVVGAKERAFGRFVVYDKKPMPAASMMNSTAGMRSSRRERDFRFCLWLVKAVGIGVSIAFLETGVTGRGNEDDCIMTGAVNCLHVG